MTWECPHSQLCHLPFPLHPFSVALPSRDPAWLQVDAIKEEARARGLPTTWSQEQPQCGEKLYKYTKLGKPFSSIEPLCEYHGDLAEEPFYESQENRNYFFQDALLMTPEKICSVNKTYACNQCEKTFCYSSHLMRHKKMHTAEKFFKCQECRQAFKYSSNLRRHLRTHTGEKPFECGQCGKAFTRNFNLVLHQRNHTGEKPYVCKDCGKAFNQPSSLRSHM
ncbi:Zinc finger protein 333 [Fukomys damarensis]|uniref:Zinc finger protein 333 n=1 Tax=Fukomys damarensis TaxID=885580 RepID=A0A091D9G7_FUKDA|nr:Zinc finger protein 333 [Fukomys damarensis]